MKDLQKLKHLSQTKHPSIFFEGLILPRKILEKLFKLCDIVTYEVLQDSKHSYLKIFYKQGTFEIVDLRYAANNMIKDLRINSKCIFKSRIITRGKLKGKTELTLEVLHQGNWLKTTKLYDNDDVRSIVSFGEKEAQKLLTSFVWKIILKGA